MSMMTDAISRSAVLDRLKMFRRNYTLKAGYRDAMTDAIGEVRDAPALDAVPVVRCGDCKWYDSVFYVCSKCGVCVNRDFFCADGERE